jgi:hypothetical protein
MDQQLKDLLLRLEQLSAQVEELRESFRQSVSIAIADPEMSLTRARKALEYIVRDVYQRAFAEPPGTRPLENLLQRLVKEDHFPKRLAAYANSVRELGNVGTHGFGEGVTAKDVYQSLTQLLPIVEWYLPQKAPTAAVSGQQAPKAPPASGWGSVSPVLGSKIPGPAAGPAPARRAAVGWVLGLVGLSIGGLALLAGCLIWALAHTGKESDNTSKLGSGNTSFDASIKSPTQKGSMPPTAGPLDLGRGVTMAFVRVPKAMFWMGWDSDKKESKQVTIDRDFELGVYTVTQAQWQALMGTNPSWFSRQGQGSAAVQTVLEADLRLFPVESVAWQDGTGQDVQEFLKKLNAREQGKGWFYRLPKEAELSVGPFPKPLFDAATPPSLAIKTRQRTIKLEGHKLFGQERMLR